MLSKEVSSTILKVFGITRPEIEPKSLGKSPRFRYLRGYRHVMVKVMDCGIVVSEFVLQSRYYVHFRTNTLEKGMNPLILPAMG